MEKIVKWPFGEASTVQLSASGNQEIEINNELTIIDGVSTQATDDRTLNLTISEDVGVGAMIMVKAKTSATQATIFGNGMTGPSLTGVAGKTKTALFVFDGTSFVMAGADVQID